MNILLCSISSVHELTGIGKYNGELFDWFRSRGHRVDVLTTLPYYPYWEIYEGYRDEQYLVEGAKNGSGSVYSFRLPVSKNVTSKRRVLMDSTFGLKTLYRLPWLAKRNKYDIIQLVLPPITALPAATLGKHLGGSKLHIHVQDFQIEAARELKMLPSSLLKGLEVYEKFWLKSADLISSISNKMVEHATKKVNEETTAVTLLENWADTDAIKPITDKNWLKRTFGYDEDTFLVVYSGSIAEKHGVEQVLTAAHKLKDTPNIQFLILGDGAGKAHLETKRKEYQLSNLRFGDLVPKDRLNSMLNGSDLQLILQKKSSADSFLPSKYINVLSAGTASVVTANPDTELYNIANDHQTSVVVEPENPEQLSKAILEMYSDKEKCLTLGEYSRDLAVTNYSRDAILSRLENSYESLISKQ